MKDKIKSLLFKIAPGTAQTLQRTVQRRHVRQLEAGWGLPRVRSTYLEHQPFTVMSGPFAGMEYIENATGSMLLPKLVGSYEAELAPALQSILATNYASVLDIGCAEGYYAVGLARGLQKATVYAHDTDPLAQKMCAEMARLNDVSARVQVGGEVNHAEMQRILERGKSLVVCDCDGCERFLLDPQSVPALRQSDLLVETHDFLDAGVTDALRLRFAPTHTVSLFEMQTRNPQDWSAVSRLTPPDQEIALSEYRPAAQQWLYLVAR